MNRPEYIVNVQQTSTHNAVIAIHSLFTENMNKTWIHTYEFLKIATQ